MDYFIHRFAENDARLVSLSTSRSAMGDSLRHMAFGAEPLLREECRDHFQRMNWRIGDCGAPSPYGHWFAN